MTNKILAGKLTEIKMTERVLRVLRIRGFLLNEMANFSREQNRLIKKMKPKEILHEDCFCISSSSLISLNIFSTKRYSKIQFTF